jgi:type II secretory pathway pseudopilin PulG
MKKRRGFFMVELVIGLVVSCVLLGGVMMASGTSKQSSEARELKNQCVLLDQALAGWQESHSGVYPDQLSTLVDLGMVSSQIDFTKFSYTTQNNGTEYRLEATLPVGGTYKSPNSKY